MKHLLLISYTFPPNPGIGGRRWAKFAKYLTRQNLTVHVIYADIKTNGTSLWNKDVTDNPAIIRYPVKSNYPQVLVSNPDTLLKKIKYKVCEKILKSTTNGTPYDVAIGWRKPLLKKANEIIKKHQIKNVIVSCAPFRSAVYALELKQQNPDLNLMVDLRDPWTWGRGYGMTLLNQSKLASEKNLEKQVVENANYIFVPVQVMQNHLTKTYPSVANKIKLLEHAFDEDEVKPQQKTKSEKIRLIFFGSLYEYIEPFVTKLAEEIKKYQGNYTLDIYSDSLRYSNIFLEHGILNEQVNYHPSKPATELFKLFGNYDFVLLIHPDYGKDNISTKFYEIIYSKTPILYIGNQGLTAEFINNNQLGLHYDCRTLDLNPERLRNYLREDRKEFKGLGRYAFSSQTQYLTEHFI